MGMVRQEEIDFYNKNLKDVAKAYLTPARKNGGAGFYVCPVCGSGSGPNGTGALRISDKGKSPHFKCYACENKGIETKGRAIDLVKLVENTDFRGAVESLRRTFGNYFPEERDERGNVIPWFNRKEFKPFEGMMETKEAGEYEERERETKKRDFSKFYWGCQQNLIRTGWKEVRGIPVDLCLKYGVGYCPKWLPPDKVNDVNNKMWPTRRYIIPYNEHAYYARDLNPNNTYNPKLKFGGNGLYLYNEMKKEEPKSIFIVEGQFDALSIVYAGGNAVSIGNLTDQFCKAYSKDKLNAVLVVSLDNDRGGEDIKEKMRQTLSKYKDIPHIYANVNGNFKDANEFLQKDKEGFFAKVKEVKEKAEELYRRPTQAIPSARKKQDGEMEHGIS